MGGGTKYLNPLSNVNITMDSSFDVFGDEAVRVLLLLYSQNSSLTNHLHYCGLRHDKPRP